MESADSKEQTNLTTIVENVVQEALQVVPSRIQANTGFLEYTMAWCDTGSSQTWVDQKLLKKVNLDGEEETIHRAVNHETSPIQSKEVGVTLGPADSTVANKCNIMVHSRTNLAVWKKE